MIRLIIVIILIAISKNVYSNSPDYNKFENPKSSYKPILFSKVPIKNSKNGTFLTFNYPGFFSVYGQVNFNYTNAQRDNFFIGLGAIFINVGFNKHIVESNYFNFYINGCIGKTSDGFLGDLGVSFLKVYNKDETFEISINYYFHQGYDGRPILGYITNLRGISSIFHYTTKITKKINLSLSFGLSLIQYRYMRNYDGGDGTFNQYEYVTYEVEKYNLNNNGYLDSPSWDNHLVFPIGISLGYFFNNP